MKTLLAFPPASDPGHPPLGIASLAGLLRSRGEDVTLLDLNVLSYSYLLSAERLRACSEKISGRTAELEERAELEPDAAEEYRLLVKSVLPADYLAEAVPRAVRDLRKPSTYASRPRYARAAELVRRGMELVSAAHFPVRWYARGFSMSHLPTRSAEVLQAVSDGQENIFRPFFESQLDPLATIRFDVVGISLNYYCQLIPAMTLAQMVKERFPDSVLTVGGGLVCFFEDRWEALAPFRHLVDVWVPFEGERPLAELLSALERGRDLSEVPGLLQFEGAAPVFLEQGRPIPPAELPAPSFDGLPLGEYLAPELVLPLLTSRGCYWARCAFCSHHKLYRGPFRTRPTGQVVEQMQDLAARHGCRHFYFTDECLAPRVARQLAAELRRRALPYEWFTEIRFERALDARAIDELAGGGCRMLMFGLESGVQRVLDLMDKGITPDRAAAILERCHTAGIRTFVMFFTGFPTETAEEAQETVRFLGTTAEWITQVAFSNFILEQQAPVHSDPERYGVIEILPYEDEDLKIYSRYRANGGLSMEEAIAFLERARDDARIKALIDTFLVSRSHLPFLPPRAATSPDRPGKPRLRPADREDAFPIRAAELVPRSLPFDLGDLRGAAEGRHGTAGANGERLRRSPKNYVYSAEREKLVEVGAHGIELLAACDGRFTLGDILSAVGKHNRDTTLRFFDDLEAAGFLRWERRA
jgi:radical SAM superfamily enzyme YgiQ (UPF0313 family)